MKKHSECGNFKTFASKIFMNATNINTLEDCRYNLELLFEESFNPHRDFIDYLALKKDQKYE